MQTNPNDSYFESELFNSIISLTAHVKLTNMNLIVFNSQCYHHIFFFLCYSFSGNRYRAKLSNSTDMVFFLNIRWHVHTLHKCTTQNPSASKRFERDTTHVSATRWSSATLVMNPTNCAFVHQELTRRQHEQRQPDRLVRSKRSKKCGQQMLTTARPHVFNICSTIADTILEPTAVEECLYNILTSLFNISTSTHFIVVYSAWVRNDNELSTYSWRSDALRIVHPWRFVQKLMLKPHNRINTFGISRYIGPHNLFSSGWNHSFMFLQIYLFIRSPRWETITAMI